MEAPDPAPALPPVSVVIPVRDEAPTIEAAVRCALDQDYPDLEVVVADGMSTDGTREALARLAASDPRVRVLDNPLRVTPAGLNAAIRAARGEVIVRCDAHSFLPPGYVARCVALLAQTGGDNVGGMQVPVGETALQRAIAVAMTTPMGVGGARFHLGGRPGPVDTVYLGAFRRAALERVALFDESLARNQDSELNHRLRESGGVVYFHPDLRVTYRPRASLGALWRQYRASGAWVRETVRRHPRAIRPRQLAPPLLVLGLTASLVLALTPARVVAGVVPVAYAAAVVAAAVVLAVRRRDPAALLLGGVLPVMHVGWGLGFLTGLVRHPRATGRPEVRGA